jgi:CDP-6-deoxy-D-xylo-4-hexulose-3-dehydrase
VIEALHGTDLSVIVTKDGKYAYEDHANSWMLIPLRVDGENPKMRKKEILQKLETFGVETRPVLTGNFLSQPAMNRIDGNHLPPTTFPIATEITDTSFLVGAHHDLTEDQILHLCNSLREAQF